MAAEPSPRTDVPRPFTVAGCYAGFAAFALMTAVVSGQPVQRSWGAWAAGGYAAAAIFAGVSPPRTYRAALLAAAVGAIAAPLTWQVTGGSRMSKDGEGALQVIARAGTLLIRHGTPYLPGAKLNGPESYNPYEPFLAVFGLPRALGLTGWAGNPRLWLGLTSVIVIWGAFRLVIPSRSVEYTAFVFTSPLLALPLDLGGTDLPVIALLCMTLALASRGWPGRAATALGVACAMKATAWAAVPVMLALFAHRDGWPAGRRFTATTLAIAVGAMALTAPAGLADPAALVRNTVLFPLGLTRRKTTAASPLPGHLLAGTGSAGRWAVLVLLAALVFAATAWLALRPPAGLREAAWRLAVCYAVAFSLAPAGRWGYFAYPLIVLGWSLITSCRSPATGPPTVPPPAARSSPSGSRSPEALG